MGDEAVQADLVQRFEELVRENARLARVVADLEPAVGHTVLLVKLLDVAREYCHRPSEELHQAMVSLIDEYDGLRGR